MIATVGTLKALNLLFTPLPTLRYFGAWVDALTERFVLWLYSGVIKDLLNLE